MTNISDIIRSSEILGFCLSEEKYSKADLAEKYNISEVSINRDLRELRKQGIQIYSRKGNVELLEKPSKEILVSLAADYLPLKLNSDVFIKQLRVFSKTNPQFFQFLVQLAKAVDESLEVNFNYKRGYDKEVKNYQVKPIRLFNLGLNWILNGYKENENEVKTFYVNRIQKIELVDKKFSQLELSEKKEKLYEIILRFNPQVVSDVKDKIWFDNFLIEEDKEGFTILKTKQPITNSLASWCISWYDMIEILKPQKLKDQIRVMITNFSQLNF